MSNAFDLIIKQIAILAKEGRFDEALMYTDTLTEDLKKAQDVQATTNRIKALNAYINKIVTNPDNDDSSSEKH